MASPSSSIGKGLCQHNEHPSPWTDNHRIWQSRLVRNKSPELLELGQRIRAARTSLGFSQEDLAHESEIDRSYIGGVERGERNLTFTVLCKIARALRSDAAALTKDLPPKRR